MEGSKSLDSGLEPDLGLELEDSELEVEIN
jgi:hypothetical protein